jgi:hypothetical protein
MHRNITTCIMHPLQIDTVIHVTFNTVRQSQKYEFSPDNIWHDTYLAN